MTLHIVLCGMIFVTIAALIGGGVMIIIVAAGYNPVDIRMIMIGILLLIDGGFGLFLVFKFSREISRDLFT